MATLEPTAYTAFAVYSADDNSLNFYKRDTVPTAGSRFNGKTATAVYRGFETDIYIWDSNAGVPTTPWHGYLASITSVSFVDSGIAPVSTNYWFYGMNNASLTTIGGLDKLDTSKVMDMVSMFNKCSSLTSLDVSNFNTINVTNMSAMFSNCSKLTSLDVSNFDTSKVTNMNNMFGVCSALTSLDVSNFDTTNVTDMSYMFGYCSALTSLDASSFDTSKVTDMSSMFYNCSVLTSLDASNFDTSKVTNMSMMFSYCTALTNIYVSDKWNIASVTSSFNMFNKCSNLPNYNSSMIDKTNAHYNSGGYLTYKAIPHTLTFNSNTGIFPTDNSATKSVKIILDGTVSLSSLVEFPTKSGYVFRGWSTSSTGVVTYAPYATPTITEDTTLYAVWVKAENYLVREDTLVNIANAVRTKTGGTDAIALNDMATVIAAVYPVTIINGLSTTLEIHTYNPSSGFVKTEIQAGATETHNLYDGTLAFGLPVAAKVTTVGAKTDLTNVSLAAGAYCIGFAGSLSLRIFI